MIDKTQLPNGCDCDAAYEILHGSQESPGSFRGRYQRQELTDAEHAKCTGATTPDEAFALVYPDYVSQHLFREEWNATEPPALTVVSDDIEADE